LWFGGRILPILLLFTYSVFHLVLHPFCTAFGLVEVFEIGLDCDVRSVYLGAMVGGCARVVWFILFELLACGL